MDVLRAITLFVQAAAAGSFHRAAVDQAISPQAVSKAIRQLEAHLGLRLFHRTTRRSSLTAEGRAFLESVQPALDAIQRAVSRARAQTETVEGVLRITAPHVARRALAQPIAEFAARHPNLSFELLMEDAFTDIVAAKIDVGFRVGAAPSGQVIVRRLLTVQQMMCAAPSYIARYGMPATVAELARHRCTRFRLTTSGRLSSWDLTVDDELRDIAPPAAFVANDVGAELDAVRAGVGIGLIDSVNGAGDIRAGRLVPVLPELRGAEFGFFVYYAARTHLPRRVRAFVDFIVERLRGSTAFSFDTIPAP
jgi:DNA-binding transcriptional LysR family regulator